MIEISIACAICFVAGIFVAVFGDFAIRLRETFAKRREIRQKRKARKKDYKKLISLAVEEINTGAPYSLDIAPACVYLQAGMYEEYFKDLQRIAKDQVNKRIDEAAE